MLTTRHVLLTIAATLVATGTTTTMAYAIPARASDQCVEVALGDIDCPKTDDGTPSTPGSTPVRQPSEEELKHRRDIQNYCDLVELEDANRQAFGAPSDLANNARYQSYCTPAGSTPGDAGTAARQVVAGMNLPAPTIGMTPPPTTVRPDSVGLVGVNNWLWVENPEIFGTITDTATLDAWTITVTATVESVDWNMGDGHVIHCTGPGTPYVRGTSGWDPSPDCGHMYTEQGYYTVTATAHWLVQWNSTDQTGTLTTDQATSAPVVIGEWQVRLKRSDYR